MPEYTINMSCSNEGTRNEVRMGIINKFAEEKPGQGNKDLASRYTYYVEQLSDGRRIYLRRPANLHYGFDFLVCVEKTNFNPNGRKRNNPKQDDIINDLKEKSKESSGNYKKLLELLEKVYLCKDIDSKLIENNFSFKTGFSCELILKVLKWLFIEQDIRYWNYSGRDMLWNVIKGCN